MPPISTIATSQSCADLPHGVLDLVGDVRDDLDSLAEVVAAAFLGDDLLVDPPGGQIVVAGQLRVGEALVVAKIQVGLSAIVGHKDFAMLERRHRARIDIQVRVKLHQVDLDAAGLKQAANRSRRESLAEGRHDSARYKDVLCRHVRDLIIFRKSLCRVGTPKYGRMKPPAQ